MKKCEMIKFGIFVLLNICSYRVTVSGQIFISKMAYG